MTLPFRTKSCLSLRSSQPGHMHGHQRSRMMTDVMIINWFKNCTLLTPHLSFGLLKNNLVSPMLCARVSDAVLDLKTVAANQLKEVDDEATEGALVGLDTGSGCELKTDVRILPTVSMGKGDLGNEKWYHFIRLSLGPTRNTSKPTCHGCSFNLGGRTVGLRGKSSQVTIMFCIFLWLLKFTVSL